MKYASYFVELSLYFLFLEVLLACFSTVHSTNAPKKFGRKNFSVTLFAVVITLRWCLSMAINSAKYLINRYL